MKELTFYVVIGVVLLSGNARATSFFPYPEQCVADAEGRYYVIVKRKDKGDPTVFPYGPVTLTIAERRTGSPQVRSASAEGPDGDSFLARVDPKIRVRDGDIVHGHIDLDQPPSVILVSSRGQGIVTLDVYGFNNLGLNPGQRDLVIYSVKGKVLHQKERRTLFGEAERRHFPRLDGVLSWLGNSWLDEKRGQVVVVGNARREQPEARPFVTVSLASGDVRPGGPDLVERAITERNSLALSAALELARAMKLRGCKTSLPGIVEDGTLPLGPRLRAAVLLASFGDRRGAGLVSRAVLAGADPEAGSPKFRQKEEVFYAIQNCPELLGEDALPLLKKAIQKNGQPYWLAFRDAFCSLGRTAVPTLISVLDDDGHFEGQLEAATCLGFLGPEAEESVPALIRALHKKGRKKVGGLYLSLRAHAAWALEHVGAKAKAAIPDLEHLAEDPDEHTRDSVRRALAAIGGKGPS